jgi:surface protein
MPIISTLGSLSTNAFNIAKIELPKANEWFIVTLDKSVNLTATFNIFKYVDGVDIAIIDWGDGTLETVDMFAKMISGSQAYKHTYKSLGQKTVKIATASRTFSIGCDVEITTVNQWGTNVWSSCASMFAQCDKFISVTATDTPNFSNVTDMSGMFSDARRFNQPVDNWNTSNVTDMRGMFGGAMSFNQPVNSWNTSNVTDMSYMFNSAFVFNQPLFNWNTSNVTDMRAMFNSAKAFNQSLFNWNTSNVTNMRAMFSGSLVFNQPVDNWNVSNVTNMSGMFNGAKAFNQPLNSWDVSNVTDMNGMFNGTDLFNKPLNSWNVSKVTDVGFMFFNTKAFNQNLSTWVTGLLAQPGTFSGFANAAWVASKATTFPFLADGVTRINT